MTEDRDKKIAEIRERSLIGKVARVQANTVHDLLADIRFLLSELERKNKEHHEDRIEMDKSIFRMEEDNRKLREEIQNRMKWAQGREADFDRIIAERDKLVEALRWYESKSDAYVSSYGADPCGISKRARTILSELGIPERSDSE